MTNPLDQLITKLTNQIPSTKKRVLKRGEILIYDGSYNQDIYIVNQGCIHMYMMINDQPQSIRFAYNGSLFTAIDSFFGHQANQYIYQAIRKTEIQIIPKSDFDYFISQDQDHLVLWNKVLQLLILSMVERENDLLHSNPKDRLDRVLRRSPQLFQYVPHKYIASYLRMSPETLSRLQKS